MTMADTVTSWDDGVIARVQHLLDRSLERAGVVQRSFFGKPERRLAAKEFLSTWNSIYMCAVATAGATGWPHLAAIRLEFDTQAVLPMLLYLGTARERDLRERPNVALQKQDDNGTVLTCYARAQFTGVVCEPDTRGRTHTRVLLTPVRLYGIGRYVSGPYGGVPAPDATAAPVGGTSA
jgi:hypothetical protein